MNERGCFLSFMSTLLFFVVSLQGMLREDFNQFFIKNFVDQYEVGPGGRYSHEYDLSKLTMTSESLTSLEEWLRTEGLSLDGRIVIFGYEENAVSRYYTNFKKSKIDDEAILKNATGWSLKLHNRFGIITGFLFRDFNAIGRSLMGENEPIFEHINPASILVFDDKASIFQEHAFGEILGLLYQAQEIVTNDYIKKSMSAVLEDIIKFWQIIYKNAFKVGNKEIAGTQDILFSIEYLKHLVHSNLPFIKFYTGPDITYPIEISCKQGKGATQNAQDFVKILSKKLQPLDDRPTVYIFCSFVDGVGKSTMLGNIKNWMKHQDDYSSFEHVDNTSSQLVELFKFKDNVYIADLPAQISHFTYKPDGVVFVDAKTVYEQDDLEKLALFVETYKDTLIRDYKEKLAFVADVIKQQGFFAAELNDKNKPVNWFLRNLILLHKQRDNYWIPFECDGITYLFNKLQPWEFRLVQPLGAVNSEGLKNVSAEQMFFCDGVRFPLPYNAFLDQLVDMVKKEKIEKVVFVDFLSMYPRSSRENIRINYLLQQMALLDDQFDVKQSLYCDFVSGGQLLDCLLRRHSCLQLTKFLEFEVLIRLALFRIIVERKVGELDGVSVKDLGPVLEKKIKEIDPADKVFLQSAIDKKLAAERNLLERTYGLSKPFINIQLFILRAAYAYSQILRDFFENHLFCEQINDLWSDYGDLVCPAIYEQGLLQDVLLNTTSGKPVKAAYAVSEENKDQFVLTPFLRLLRANWYAAISNLLYAAKKSHEVYQLEKPRFNVVPFLLKKGNDELFYVVTPVVDAWPSDKKLPPINKHFFLQLQLDLSKAKYGDIEGNPYLVSWKPKGTHKGIYAFDCDLDKLKDDWQIKTAVSLWVRKYQTDNSGSVIPTFDLYKKLYDSAYWRSEAALMVQQTKDFQVKNYAHAGMIYGNRNIVYGVDSQRSAAKMLIRLLVTLEMIIKDPDSDIVVRYGNRDDFKTAIKLFEKITLPRYYGIMFHENLFKDYEVVEPYPSWDFWDKLRD